MRRHSRFSRWIPLIGILGFLFGCLLGIVIPEKEDAPHAIPTTVATTVATAASTTEPTFSQEEQWIAEFLADSGDAIRRIDLDLDGSEELLRYRGDTLIQVCTVSPEGVISLMESYALFLCENGIIGRYSEGAGGHTGFFYQLADGQFQCVECVVYHWQEDAWYRSPDLTANDTTLVPITEDERMEILGKYPCAEPVDRSILQAIYE